MKKLVSGIQKFQWVFLIFFILLPFLGFLLKTFSFATLFELLEQKSFFRAIGNSVILATWVSVPATVTAFGALWLLRRYQWGKRVQRATEFLLKAPYFVPPFFLGMGWIALAAPSAGYLNLLTRWVGIGEAPSIYGLSGAAFVLFFWTVPLCAIQLQGFFDQFPGILEDAATLCGARPGQALQKIVFPLAKPYLVHCFLTAFVSTLAAFGVPALLAMPARQNVITTRVFQSIKGTQNFSEAAILSFVLLMITCVLLILQKKFFSTKDLNLVSGKASSPSRVRPGFLARASFFALGVLIFVGTILPLSSVVLLSFLSDRSNLFSFSLQKYEYVFAAVPDGLNALQNSALAAFIAAVFIQFLALVVAYGSVRFKLRESKFLAELWSFLYALPGTVLALVLLIFFNGTLSDTLWILALAYALKYAAFSVRTLVPALGALSKDFEEAAWMAGASQVQAFFKIVVPLLLPALSAAFFLSFLPMLSELTMSVFLSGAGTQTVGTLIYHFLDYADPGAAAVLAVFLIALTLLMNGFLRKISKGSFGI